MKYTKRYKRYAFAGLITGLIMVGLLVLFYGSAAAGGATITVNTTDDELNADSDCSLREAVQAANTDAAVDGCTAGTGADTIVLSAGTYVLSLSTADEDNNASGDLDILSDIVIEGAGASTTVIDGNGTDRVLDLDNGSSLAISDVTISNGDPGNGLGARPRNTVGECLGV